MLLIRHAQSEWNLHFGRTRIDPGLPDPDLTAHGVGQAERAAAELSGRAIDTILASPYRRCLQTAEIIAGQIGAPIRIEPIIRERCAFSCDQGSHPDELARVWPHLVFDHLTPSWWGGTCIESQESIDERARRFRDDARSWADHERVLVVSHWGFLRALTGFEVDNATLVTFDPHTGKAAIEAVEA